ASSASAGYDDSGTLRHDMLTGNGDDNVIDGRGGNDTILGGGGNDTLIGGSGNDTLTGGGGMDTFVISGRDTITDFTEGNDGDKLSFGSSSRILNLNYMLDENNNNKLVITSGSHRVTFDDVTVLDGINELTAANFDFNPDGYVKLTDNSPTGQDSTRGNTTILGGAGDNRLTGGNNADRIFGGGGDDTIEGRAGSDTLDGGEGGEENGDTLSYAGSTQRSRKPNDDTLDTDDNPYITGVTVVLNTSAAGPGTYAGGDTFTNDGNFENLIGSSRDDNLTGDSQANVIDGGSGNDTITGGGGADTLKGGSGYDVITGGGDGDKVEGGSQSDRLTGSGADFLSYEGSSGVTVDLSDLTTRDLSQTEADRFTTDGTPVEVPGIIKVSRSDASGDIATGFVNVIGGGSGDTLTGNDAANELRGMGGNDRLTGGDGADTLKGGAGNDNLKGGTGNDMLDGGPGGDDLEGGGTEAESGVDTATYASATEGVTVDLSGGNSGRGDAAGDSFDGIEQYVGSYHADIFIAGDDPDHITGGPTTGGPGDAGDTSNDTVSYARSDKGVTVELGSVGSGSVQTSTGYASGDTLTNIENVIGSRYVDNLTAHTGGSIITGGRGDDTLEAGGGSDTFVFAPGDGDDEITNFGTDGVDKIDLSAFTSIASLEDLRDTNNSNGEISVTGTAVEINLPSNGEIRLNGVTSDTLTADNFIFYTKRISGNMGDRFNNEINGGNGDDAIYGEQGRDILNGGAGDDEIYGGEDNDIINGGAGDDWLDGGPGIDTFVFEPGHGNDYIMDFDSGEKIDLRAFTNDAGGPLVLSDITGDNPVVDGNYVIDLSNFGGGTITVLGVTSDATESDFIFS
ncbi:MAG: hypothetical protein OXE42_16905, partial [Gammaproteobacteria bacterium]|nr:hypothetical protein [Gammaproteobacteria bacterium]